MTSRSPCHREHGFTLIELMIAVVVVGLLLSVALPSFLDSIRKSRRSDAYQALSAVQQAQERRRANVPAYTGNLTAALPTGLALTSTSPAGYYTITIPAADATGYTVLATAVSGKSQVNDSDCVRLQIRMAVGNLFYGFGGASGTIDETVGNKCWNR